MADDKDLERQYRKNLMVVASIVLIYSIAGGHMGDDLTMFGAKLKFSRPDWLEWAMVVVMCFFWWRHWQVSKTIRREIFYNAVKSFVIPCFTYERIKRDTCKALSLNEDQYTVRWCYNSVQVMPIGGFDNDGYHITLDTVGFASITLSYLHEVSLRYSLDRAWLVCSILYRKSWIKNAIIEPQFGDAILPSITTMAALIAYGIQKLA